MRSFVPISFVLVPLLACAGDDTILRSAADGGRDAAPDATHPGDAGSTPSDAAASDAAASDAARGLDAGPSSFSFVVVGCNRVDKADVSPANPSTANLEQLTRTFREVAALTPPPKYFFFAGDLVVGYTSDTAALEAQLTAWRGLYEASPLPAAGVKLVAITGNHESQDETKTAFAGAESTWLKVMGPYIAGSNGPKAGGDDQLATDQSRLTYSFDEGSTHFVVLDTDPVGKDWRVPVKWVAADVAAARAAGARHVFAIGHKPAFADPAKVTDGLYKYPAARDALWSALEANHAEAMLSAHNHLWLKLQPNAGKTWQIIAGNGGSPLEITAPPDGGAVDAGASAPGAYFGFTLVTVGADGSVTLKSHGRDVPADGYLKPSDAYPTTVRDTVDLTWR